MTCRPPYVRPVIVTVESSVDWLNASESHRIPHKTSDFQRFTHDGRRCMRPVAGSGRPDRAGGVRDRGQPASRPFKWWQSEQFQKELGLTPEQIDADRQRSSRRRVPSCARQKDELDRARSEAVAADRDRRRRSAGRRVRSTSVEDGARQPEQDAHADAAADAAGAHARPAGQVQGAARAVGARTEPANARQRSTADRPGAAIDERPARSRATWSSNEAQRA